MEKNLQKNQHYQYICVNQKDVINNKMNVLCNWHLEHINIFTNFTALLSLFALQLMSPFYIYRLEQSHPMNQTLSGILLTTLRMSGVVNVFLIAGTPEGRG